MELTTSQSMGTVHNIWVFASSCPDRGPLVEWGKALTSLPNQNKERGKNVICICGLCHFTRGIANAYDYDR